MNKFRIIKDQTANGIMMAVTIISIAFVFVMAIGLYFKSIPILEEHSLWGLLTDSSWQPFKNHFGFLPFIMGTIWVTLLAILIALPLSLMTAVFLTEYAKKRVKKFVFPALDILASLPSVIFGVWGTIVIVPLISDNIAPILSGEFSTGYTVLAAGIVLSLMLVPILVSLFVELFSTVPDDLRAAAYSLGATRWQTAKNVVIKKSLSGIFASVVLAISKALGETIAVLMVCGCFPEVPKTLLDACYPLPALIANNYGEMLSLPLYESALMFAALLLLVVVIIFNLASRLILRKIEKR